MRKPLTVEQKNETAVLRAHAALVEGWRYDATAPVRILFEDQVPPALEIKTCRRCGAPATAPTLRRMLVAQDTPARVGYHAFARMCDACVRQEDHVTWSQQTVWARARDLGHALSPEAMAALPASAPPT